MISQSKSRLARDLRDSPHPKHEPQSLWPQFCLLLDEMRKFFLLFSLSFFPLQTGPLFVTVRKHSPCLFTFKCWNFNCFTNIHDQISAKLSASLSPIFYTVAKYISKFWKLTVQKKYNFFCNNYFLGYFVILNIKYLVQ